MSVKTSKIKAFAGFTLIEVMIALLIVSTALPALILLVMAQVDGAGHVREKTYAMWIAENELTRLGMLSNKKRFPDYKLPEKDSGKVEMMGLQWQWQLETSKSDDMPIPNIVKADIGVVLLGLSSGGYGGAKGFEKVDPVASLVGYLSE